MTWFPLSDEFYSDPRFISASDSAVALYARAASWSARHLTDGRVPSTALPLLTSATDEAPLELVECGAWKRTRGGFLIIDFPEFCTREKVEAKRRSDRERQSRLRGSEKGGKPSNRRSEGKVSRRDSSATRVGVADVSPTSRFAPKPMPTTPPDGGGDPPGGGADAPDGINAGIVVGAWVEAMNGNGVKPTAGMRAQVGRLARELLGADNDPTKVLEAAVIAGRKGYSTIDREMGALNGQRLRVVGQYEPHRDPTTGRAVDW